MEEELNVFHVAPDQAGLRLDAALSRFFPDAGLRARRRLCERLRVNGVFRSPAYRLRGDEVLSLTRTEEPVAPLRVEDTPRLLAQDGAFFFFYKPSGLHTEALAGGGAPALSSLLGGLLPEKCAALKLLTRLDCDTSGIVVAAAEEEAARLWREWENAARIEKEYFAILEGVLCKEKTVRNALDARARQKTRVLPDEAEALRHTIFRALGHVDASDVPCFDLPESERLTLALCLIRKGARHQIRVHAAHIGHPLAGDRLYGAKGRGAFRLHHARVVLPGCEVRCPVPWRDIEAFSEGFGFPK